jgi:hypothetical protein
MPALPKLERVRKRAVRVLEKGHRCTGADVHVGLAGNESDAKTLGGAKDPIVVVCGAEVERGCCASTEEFNDSELGRRFNPVTIERRLIGPGAKPEPVEEFESVRLVPEQRLYNVDVALNEARKDCSIAGVKDAGGTAILDRAIGHGRNSAVANSDFSPEMDSVRDHWQNQAVPDHQIRRK